MNIRQAIASRRGRGLLPFQVMDLMNSEMVKSKWVSECTTTYMDSIRDFIEEKVAKRLAILRERRGMYEAMERIDEWDEEMDLSMGASGRHSLLYNRCRADSRADADKAVVDNKAKVTEAQLRTFLQIAWTKYVKARIEPG